MTEWFFGIKIKALKMTVMTVWCCQTILFQSKNNGKKFFCYLANPRKIGKTTRQRLERRKDNRRIRAKENFHYRKREREKAKRLYYCKIVP